jgi:hypothetical protein
MPKESVLLHTATSQQPPTAHVRMGQIWQADERPPDRRKKAPDPWAAYDDFRVELTDDGRDLAGDDWKGGAQ